MVDASLMFEAGQVAARRGWSQPVLLEVGQVGDLDPVGPPVVLVGRAGAVDIAVGRLISAVAGAGRPIVLVTDAPVAGEVAAWLPTELVHIAGVTIEPEPEASPIEEGLAGLSSDQIHALCAAADPAVRQGLARRPDTPREVLGTLATDPDAGVQSEVAGNPNTPVGVLRNLAGDPGEFVRSNVGGNSTTPVEVLRALATDPDEFVRCGVAGNPNTPVEVLAALATDPDLLVRFDMACNPMAPGWVLGTLATDATLSDEIGLCDVGSHPNMPVEGLRALATDPDERVRCRVAGNPNTPVEVLLSMASTRIHDVIGSSGRRCGGRDARRRLVVCDRGNNGAVNGHPAIRDRRCPFSAESHVMRMSGEKQ